MKKWIFILCVFMSCSKKEDPTTVDIGLDYYPISIGAYWTYKIDSIAYDNNTGTTRIDTFAYFYKETISGSFVDAAGETAYTIKRFVKPNDSASWLDLNVWTVSKSNFSVQKVQENIRYVKLFFPLSRTSRWNGNAYNALGNEDYKVTGFEKTAFIGGVSYPTTIQVQHKNELNAVQEDRRYEIFAKNTGMIYRLSDSINTQLGVSKGYRFRQTLIEYSR